LQRVQLAFRWLEDAARSPPGLELLSDEGDRYSGIFVIIGNRPLYQFAVRHAHREQHNNQDMSEVRRPVLFDEYPDWDETYPFGR